MLTTNNKNLLFEPLVLSGTSGSGKTHLINNLVARGAFGLVLSTTDRAPRIPEMGKPEVNGIDYDFCTSEEYQELKKQGDFFMSNNIHGANYGYRRSSFEQVYASNRIPAAVVHPATIRQFQGEYPYFFGIYMYSFAYPLLRARMLMRGDVIERVESRIKSIPEEVAQYKTVSDLFKYAFEITNDIQLYDIEDLIYRTYQVENEN